MFTTLIALPLLGLGSAAGPAEPLQVRAHLPAGLETGRALQLTIDFALDPGWKVPANPLLGTKAAPAALLQLAVPGCVELVGPEPRSLSELLGTLFLNRPFETLLEPGSNLVAFRLRRPPGPDERIEFNVLTYLQPSGAAGSDGARLVRRRFALPLRPGARSRPVDPSSSSWGRGDFLQLGDQARPFELMSPFGEPALLDDLLGQGPLVLTTYRSCL